LGEFATIIVSAIIAGSVLFYLQSEGGLVLIRFRLNFRFPSFADSFIFAFIIRMDYNQHENGSEKPGAGDVAGAVKGQPGSF
jgi:hypothetical protein